MSLILHAMTAKHILGDRTEDNTLTAAEATGELDFKDVTVPLSKCHFIFAQWNGVPSLETAESVHIEPEEISVTGGIW